MILALDVDDVCLSLMDNWLSMYNKDYEDNLKEDIIDDWDIRKFVKPNAHTSIYEYINKPDVFLNAKPVLGALDYVNHLKSLGHRIIYVTANNPNECKQEWLKKWGFLQDNKDFVQAYDKSLILADCLLDDRYENARDFNGIGYLLTRPWNKKYNYPYRVDSWTDFIRKIV
jgi:5'(3')-deoxyribonucleotidase